MGVRRHRGGYRGQRGCYRCGKQDHVVAACPELGKGKDEDDEGKDESAKYARRGKGSNAFRFDALEQALEEEAEADDGVLVVVETREEAEERMAMLEEARELGVEVPEHLQGKVVAKEDVNWDAYTDTDAAAMATAALPDDETDADLDRGKVRDTRANLGKAAAKERAKRDRVENTHAAPLVSEVISLEVGDAGRGGRGADVEGDEDVDALLQAVVSGPGSSSGKVQLAPHAEEGAGVGASVVAETADELEDWLDSVI